MRRAMLTATAAAPALTPIGYDPTLATNILAANYTAWSTNAPAAENGTVTSVSANFSTGGTVAFFTVSPSAVIRAIGANVTASTGTNSYAVNLAVQAGDYVGVYMDNRTARIRYATSAVGSTGFSDSNLPATKPTAGATLTNDVATGSRAFGIRATGVQ